MVQCPRCGTPIQPTWDWCHSCGFDPEGLKPVGWHASAALPGTLAAAPPPAAPPQFAPPPGASGQSFGPLGYAPPTYMGAPPSPPKKGGSTAVGVILGVGLTFVLLFIVLVGAVALLGKNGSSKFSSIPSAISDANTNTGPTTTAPLVWTAWSPPDRSFAIDFPGPPQTKTAPIANDSFSSFVYYQYDAPNRTEFAIAVFDIKPDLYVTDPALYIKNGAQGYSEASGGTMGLFEPGDFAGMPSARFIVTGAKGYQHQAILLVGGQRIFIIAIATPIGQPVDAPTFEHFLNSFHIS